MVQSERRGTSEHWTEIFKNAWVAFVAVQVLMRPSFVIKCIGPILCHWVGEASSCVSWNSSLSAQNSGDHFPCTDQGLPVGDAKVIWREHTISMEERRAELHNYRCWNRKSFLVSCLFKRILYMQCLPSSRPAKVLVLHQIQRHAIAHHLPYPPPYLRSFRDLICVS